MLYHHSFQPELLAAHRDYLQKFNLIELSQELTGKRTHLTLFLFSDCIEVRTLTPADLARLFLLLDHETTGEHVEDSRREINQILQACRIDPIERHTQSIRYSFIAL